MRWCLLSLLLLAPLSGCGDDESSLLVDLRTDYVPGQEFAAVATEVTREDTRVGLDRIPALLEDDYVDGERVGEFDGITGAAFLVRVQLLDLAGALIAERHTRVSAAGGNTAVTVLISRDCREVTCPGPSDSREATECFSQRCVVPECSFEMPEFCEVSECSSDSDCTSTVACVRGRCIVGACLDEALASRCGDGEWCNPSAGCQELVARDAGPDGPDAAMGTDSGVDAGGDVDAGGVMDAGLDAGPPRCPAADGDTVALYSFDGDVGGTVLTDLVGGNPGAVNGGDANWTTGPAGCGNALGFPAAGLVTGRIPDSASWDIAPVGSIDFWFQAPADGNHRGLVSRDASGAALPGHFNAWVDVDGRLAVRIQGTGGEGLRCSESPVTPGVWHHVGVNFGAPSFQLWIDGVVHDGGGSSRIDEAVVAPFSLPCAQSSTSSIAGNDNVWVLGANNGYSNEGTTSMVVSPFRNGAIDHLRISDVRRDFSGF